MNQILASFQNIQVRDVIDILLVEPSFTESFAFCAKPAPSNYFAASC